MGWVLGLGVGNGGAGARDGGDGGGVGDSGGGGEAALVAAVGRGVRTNMLGSRVYGQYRLWDERYHMHHNWY